MNRNLNRFAAFFLALILTLSLCAAWAEETDENPVLVTVDGQEITLNAVKDSLNQLIEAGYASDESAFSLAMEYLIQDIVLKGKISELGLDQFTEDEEEALRADAHAEWESAIDSYVSYVLTEDTDEARAEARSNAEALYASYGYSVESIQADLMMQDGYERLQNSVYGDADVTVTDAQIQ